MTAQGAYVLTLKRTLETIYSQYSLTERSFGCLCSYTKLFCLFWPPKAEYKTKIDIFSLLIKFLVRLQKVLFLFVSTFVHENGKTLFSKEGYKIEEIFSYCPGFQNGPKLQIRFVNLAEDLFVLFSVPRILIKILFLYY